MKNLILISLFGAFIFSSCATLREVPDTAGKYVDTATVPLVVDTIPETQIFELQIDFRNDEFSGLLLVRRMGNEHYRFVLTSHFGLTVFDMETSKREFKVHYCIEGLNRKRVLYLLRNDFSMLLNPRFFTNIKYKVEEDRLISLERSGSITKTVMSFSGYHGQWPEILKIEHPYLKLYITLTKLPDDIATPV